MSSPGPTPAPHTPVLFLKAGGSAFFSAECQDALIRVGINPDWFGDYDTVSARIRAAKIKIAEWDARTPEEQRAQAAAKPTAEDLFLSKCTASHLVQDAVYRAGRAPDGSPGRGNPCASLVDGYTEGTAPAFPGRGPATHPLSVGGGLSLAEKTQRHEQALRNQPSFDKTKTGTEPKPNTYPAAQLRADENLRGHTLAALQGRSWNDTMRELRTLGRATSDTPILQGSGLHERAGTPDERARFIEALNAGSVMHPAAVEADIVPGGTAADCINQWRERAKEEMMKAGLDAEIQRTEEEENPAARSTAAAAVSAANAEVARREAGLQATLRGTPDFTRAKASLDAAKLRRARAISAFERTKSASARLPCLRAMRSRVQAGRARTSGRTFA